LVVSRTCGSEAILAGELKIPYCLVGFPVNYATGVVEPKPKGELDRLLALTADVMLWLIVHAIEMLEERGFLRSRACLPDRGRAESINTRPCTIVKLSPGSCVKIGRKTRAFRRSSMISEEEVRYVANLARLGLTDDEVKKMSGQLGAILDSVEQIGELDLRDVSPTANALSLTNVFRPDEPRGELSREEALSTAPDPVDDLFAVPRID
jgi:aspartyl-tRNA(Asn)/glutamyl-tRNA(Gln) amidotransferase subunit C